MTTETTNLLADTPLVDTNITELAARFNATMALILGAINPDNTLKADKRKKLIEVLEELREIISKVEHRDDNESSIIKAHIYFRAAYIYSLLANSKLAYEHYQYAQDQAEKIYYSRAMQTIKKIGKKRLKDFNVEDTDNPVLPADKLAAHQQQQITDYYQAIRKKQVNTAIVSTCILTVLCSSSFAFTAYILIANAMAMSILIAAGFFAIAGICCLAAIRVIVSSLEKTPVPFSLLPPLEATLPSTAMPQEPEPSASSYGHAAQQLATDKAVNTDETDEEFIGNKLDSDSNRVRDEIIFSEYVPVDTSDLGFKPPAAAPTGQAEQSERTNNGLL